MAPLAAAEVQTAVGERRTVTLPDSSRVILSPASALRIAPDFAGTTRRVYLRGQALFRVRHDSARRFLVHAGGTVAEDLGTEFDVRAYPGDSTVRVVVREGIVAVRPDRASVDSATILRPNDVARLAESGDADVLHDQNVDRLLAWTDGEIVFDDSRLADVAAELERWFAIELRFADPLLKELHLTGSYSTTSSLDEVLRIIGKSLESTGLRIERQGAIVTFTRANARSMRSPGETPLRAEVGA
jgi:ferric-dicitrate binding protein FerR (iron transport regulator)